ncbi:MAG: SpoIIE family protein phosphatase, partial [Spirochaetota bacterium]
MIKNKYKLLIVDDSKDGSELLKEMLLDNIDYCDILILNDSRKVMDTVLKENIDLILMDIQMPFMDGFEVGNLLKNNPKTADIPIIYITAVFKTDEFKKRGFDIGAIDFITKPIDYIQLSNKLKLYLKLFDRERDLRKSQAIYKAVVEDQTELICRYTQDGVITFVNEAMCRFLKKTKYQIIGSIFQLHQEIIQDDKLKNYYEYLAPENPVFTMEKKYTINKNYHRWIQWVIRAIYDNDDNFVEYQTVGSDITKLKCSEHELIESEKNFRDLFNNMSNAVAIIEAVDNGSDFIYKDVNKALLNIENKRKKEIIGKSITEIVNEQNKNELLSLFIRVWRSEKAENYSLYTFNDEEMRVEEWKECYLYKLKTGDLIFIYEDITEKKKMEDELLKSDVKHWFLLESIETPVVALKRNMDIFYCNEAFANFYGKSVIELERKNLLDVIDNFEDSYTYYAYKKVFDTGEMNEIEHYYNDRYILEKIYRTPWGIVTVMNDVTDRKKFEDEIKKLNEELENRVLERTYELEKAYQELDDKNKQLYLRNKVIEYDLSLARKVQQQIVTQLLPSNDDFEFRVIYEPMDAIGGDFYEFIVRREGDIGLFISDVSGHGASAAFITSMLKILCATNRRYSNKPALFLQKMNESLYDKIADNFVTAFYGIFSPTDKTLHYANAGHIYPILFRKKTAKLSKINMIGAVMGVNPSIEYSEKMLQLEKDDLLLFY